MILERGHSGRNPGAWRRPPWEPGWPGSVRLRGRAARGRSSSAAPRPRPEEGERADPLGQPPEPAGQTAGSRRGDCHRGRAARTGPPADLQTPPSPFAPSGLLLACSSPVCSRPGRRAMSAPTRHGPRGSRVQPLARLWCLSAALGMLWSPASRAFNLDVEKLTVYGGPEGSYFGYAVDFHIPDART